ncbi:putative transcription factor/ chromatin remodeling BED-type(Zn) family [Rosa chinensis]|uniref:Putative transcription factor/ chromatin remodeling BED-type(Zn) family n=1 Tax=Rosa chinensis TaxID=74649 RepID=A0A2P6RX07_ROSCH|nr:putative transcription factor/ chromatin remodeling BED-type(Zn) family [Rosa chinensis]
MIVSLFGIAFNHRLSVGEMPLFDLFEYNLTSFEYNLTIKSDIMEEISSTPISTPTATVDSSIGTTNSPSPTPVPQSLPPLPPLPEDDDGTSKRKNSSIVWQHFEKMKNPDGSWVKPARSKCKYCPQTYASCSRSNGTSAMRTHVMFQCRKSPIYVPNKKQKFLTFDSAESGGKLISVAYDKTTSKLACAKMVVRDELPFSFVENEGFKEFMKVTQPLFKSPSRRTIARDILKLYEAERERIRGWISVNQQRLSLTTDTWTSGFRLHERENRKLESVGVGR